MTQKSYPQILVPRLGFVAAVGLALGQVVYLALIYPTLPESVPIYYDLQGQVLGLADKSVVTVFAVPAICLVLIVGVWWCARFMGKQVAQDAAAPRHDAFSPHSARLKPGKPPWQSGPGWLRPSILPGNSTLKRQPPCPALASWL